MVLGFVIRLFRLTCQDGEGVEILGNVRKRERTGLERGYVRGARSAVGRGLEKGGRKEDCRFREMV